MAFKIFVAINHVSCTVAFLYTTLEFLKLSVQNKFSFYAKKRNYSEVLPICGKSLLKPQFVISSYDLQSTFMGDPS